MNLNPDTLATISKYALKPPLFEPGEPHFWDDPHISVSMLEAHLNPEHDAASRRTETIDKEVGHLLSSGLLKRGDRVLDLGCGPGLYASRLVGAGLKITGIDISARSIDYARRYAQDKGLDIEYRCLDFLDLDYDSEFDVIIQIYGELCTFSDGERGSLFEKIHRALKTEGRLVFDVSTRDQRLKEGLGNSWYISTPGFWCPGPHLVLQHGFDYPEHDVWLDQYIVVDDAANVTVYRDWFHDYTLQSVQEVLEKMSFRVQQTWNDLGGTRFEEGGDWIAIVAGKTGP